MSPSSDLSLISPDKPNQDTDPTDPITIDSFTDDSEIKNIPIDDTWKTYVFNSDNANISKEDWDNLPDEEKYEELFQLKPNKQSEISSESTKFTITSETTKKDLIQIPKKDCKILLREYATNQGYSHYLFRIDSMKVDAMRDELFKATKKLPARLQNSPQLNKKKTRNIAVPLVLTHGTTNDEIEAASESSILQELQSMFNDRGIYDSVMWDSLSIEELRDMARIERDEMLNLFSPSSSTVKKDNASPNAASNSDTQDKSIVVINDDDEDTSSDDDDSVEDDGIFSDVDETPNEADQFIQEQLKDAKKESKIFRFKFTHQTTDKDIFLLNHRRASRIALKHAELCKYQLSQEFMENATTDEIHQFLIAERDLFILQHQYDTFNFSATTPDSDIHKLTRTQLEHFLSYRYSETDRELTDQFFINKTDMELKLLLIHERDLMKLYGQSSTNHNKNENDPKPPNTMPKGLSAKRQNLNGWNIDSANRHAPSTIHSKVLHPNDNNTNPGVIAMAKNYFFIRASISTVGNGTHVPTIVRRFMKALRNSDPTIQLHPFDVEDTDINNVLDTESLIPDDLTALLTWVRGILSTAKRIKFSIRVSNTCPLQELRTDIFGWCKTNSCWIDMDYIESEKLFACGWLCGIHPRLYNRNDLKSWMDSKDEENNVGHKIKLYPRTIFAVDDSGKKTITNGIIIDGALEAAKDIMSFLYSIKWDERYKNAQFVPFRTSNTFSKTDQRDAMEYHNNYLHSTYRKLVRISKPTTIFQLDNGEKIDFRTWLIQSSLHEINMIEGVEKMKDGIVRIIYNSENQTGVDYIMDNLKENVIEAFGNDIAHEILGDDFEMVTQYSSEMEEQYAQKIKQAWKGKHINHKAPPMKQHTLFYGSNNSEKLYQAGDNGETRSYSEVTQSTMSMSDTQIEESKRENEELRNMVNDLTKKFEALDKKQQTFAESLKSSLKRELLKEFEGMIEGFRNEMNNTISTIETKFEKTIQTYEKNAIEREERMNNQSLSNFRIVAGELLSKCNTVTPSETSQMNVGTSLRGGDQ